MNPSSPSPVDLSAQTASLNDAAFARILAENPGFFVRSSDGGSWRATRKKSGTLRGIESFGEVEILLTDGVVAWFRRCADGIPMHGHVANFQWTEAETALVKYFDPLAKKWKFAQVKRDSGSPGPLFSLPRSSPTPTQSGEGKPKESPLSRAMRILRDLE